MFQNIGISEILIVALIVLILFGGKKLPELAQGLGKGIKDFKNAMKDETPEDKKNVTDSKEEKK